MVNATTKSFAKICQGLGVNVSLEQANILIQSLHLIDKHTMGVDMFLALHDEQVYNQYKDRINFSELYEYFDNQLNTNAGELEQDCIREYLKLNDIQI